MALADMKVIQKSVGGDVEILWNSDFVGRAITLDTTAFTDGVCKAGTPIDKDGKKAATTSTTSNAIGILLADVYEERPQGTIVYDGTIKLAVAQTHSGVTYDDPTKAALPKITFF